MSAIDYTMLLRVARWNDNYSSSERVSKEIMIEYFGQRMGEHYWDKWGYPCEHKAMKMIAYFGNNSTDGEKFCEMLTHLAGKYEERLARMAQRRAEQ